MLSTSCGEILLVEGGRETSGRGSAGWLICWRLWPTRLAFLYTPSSDAHPLIWRRHLQPDLLFLTAVLLRRRRGSYDDDDDTLCTPATALPTRPIEAPATAEGLQRPTALGPWPILSTALASSQRSDALAPAAVDAGISSTGAAPDTPRLAAAPVHMSPCGALPRPLRPRAPVCRPLS